MKILAATDFSTRSNRAVRQAGLLAQPEREPLHLLHVVDDDQPEELVRMETHEAERLLDEQADAMPELRGVECRPMVVAGSPFDGILRAAKTVDADLIVMGSHRKKLLRDIFIGTTIERVVRDGTFPILMVNNEAQTKYENVVAPIDMSDASANALRVGLSTGLMVDRRTTLLHAFSPLAKGKMFIGGADQTSIKDYVASERSRCMDELAAFLISRDLMRKQWLYRLDEGDPIDVISNAVSDMRPDLLVMGTHGPSTVLKMLIGSVTETALRSLNVDILAVPAPKS